MCFDAEMLYERHDYLLSQVLVSGARSEAPAATRRGVQGSGDLAGVPGRRSSQLHQPGLPQLRARQPEPQGPWKIQLRGRSGGLAPFSEAPLVSACTSAYNPHKPFTSSTSLR